MARNDEKAPQSYGSDSDWVTGKTGQTIEGTLDENRTDEAFYDDSLDANAKSEAPAATRADAPAPVRGRARTMGAGGKKIAESNETRQSFFRERDYD